MHNALDRLLGRGDTSHDRDDREPVDEMDDLSLDDYGREPGRSIGDDFEIGF